MPLEVACRKARATDVERLAVLINTAYRGETSRLGWTTEADLLDGLRTDAEQLHRIMADDDSMLLVCETGSQLVGSVNLQKSGASVRIGMLAVAPLWQGKGIGKRILNFAERQAQTAWSTDRFEMAVISCRRELIAFYERQGYRQTDISEPFPENPALWQPKTRGLQLSILEKPP